jgi:hypothetical protein
MAVVQISKIQHRRGRRNSGTSLPQLASGEIGWAIDTQELFIGNGSVSEGAPYVGNTKIITEHDNILDLALQYQYKRNDATIQSGPSSAQPIQRTVQERLDDVVSVRAFGAVGNGTTDDTLAIQRAIDQLYLNDATKNSPLRTYAVKLVFEAGTYKISAPLRIPPYANLQGAGKDKTIIRQTGAFAVAYSVGSDSEPGDYTTTSTMTSLNQPQFIELRDMTLEQTVANKPGLDLIAAKNSVFSNLKIKGVWAYPNTALNEESVGLRLVAKSASVSCTSNLFENIDIANFAYGVDSTYDIDANQFSKSTFYELRRGIRFGHNVDALTSGRQYGPHETRITHSRFFRITETGFEIIQGTGNVSESNTYVQVGNDGGTEETATYEIINFVSGGNVSTNDYFERSIELTSNPTYLNSVPFIPEVKGIVKSEHKFNTEIYIDSGAVGSPFIKLPANTSTSHIIHYYYTSSSQSVSRQGTIFVNVDRENDLVHLTDDCSTIGNSSNIEDLSFSATLEKTGTFTNDPTLFVRYTNSAVTEDGYINYWYETIS